MDRGRPARLPPGFQPGGHAPLNPPEVDPSDFDAIRGTFTAVQYELGEVVVRKRNRLPHWDVEHGITFVTWHLADAIPATEENAIRQRCNWYRAMIETRGGSMVSAQLKQIETYRRRLINRALDRSLGSCLLKGAAAKIVADALMFFDGDRYGLCAWCVMPNHVHSVFSCRDGIPLDRVLHSWKSYTAKEVNKVLGRSGALWHEDYFDVTMRNSRQLQRTTDYVYWNPERSGIESWPFRATYPERIAAAI